MLDPVILDSTQLATLKLALMGTPIQGPPDGLNAYELAVEQGFIGTIDQWLDSLNGKEVSLSVNSTHILWRLGDGAWQNLIALSVLSISLQKTSTHIQWRVGTGAWVNLVLLEDLRGPQGNIGFGQAPVDLYGGVVGGVTDASDAFTTADAAAEDVSGSISVPPGVWRISEDIRLTSPIRFQPGAILRPDEGVLVDIDGEVTAQTALIFDESLGGAVIGYFGGAPVQAWWGLPEPVEPKDPARFPAKSWIEPAALLSGIYTPENQAGVEQGRWTRRWWIEHLRQQTLTHTAFCPVFGSQHLGTGTAALDFWDRDPVTTLESGGLPSVPWDQGEGGTHFDQLEILLKTVAARDGFRWASIDDGGDPSLVIDAFAMFEPSMVFAQVATVTITGSLTVGASVTLSTSLNSFIHPTMAEDPWRLVVTAGGETGEINFQSTSATTATGTVVSAVSQSSFDSGEWVLRPADPMTFGMTVEERIVASAIAQRRTAAQLWAKFGPLIQGLYVQREWSGVLSAHHLLDPVMNAPAGGIYGDDPPLSYYRDTLGLKLMSAPALVPDRDVQWADELADLGFDIIHCQTADGAAYDYETYAYTYDYESVKHQRAPYLAGFRALIDASNALLTSAGQYTAFEVQVEAYTMPGPTYANPRPRDPAELREAWDIAAPYVDGLGFYASPAYSDDGTHSLRFQQSVHGIADWRDRQALVVSQVKARQAQANASSLARRIAALEVVGPATPFLRRACFGAVTPSGFTFCTDVSRAASLGLVVSTTSNFSNIVQTVSAATATEWPGLAATYYGRKMAVTGLTANTLYYVAVTLNGVRQATYQVRTAPAAMTAASFKFGVGSCYQPSTTKPVPTFQGSAQRGHRFFVQIGDWYYSDIDTDDLGRARDNITRVGRATVDFEEFAKTVAIVHIPDDHDNGGENDNHYDTAYPSQATNAELLANAREVMEECFPHYPFALDATFAQVFDWGRTRHVLIDCHWFARYTTGTTTRLGTESNPPGSVNQLQWLLDQIDQAAADGVKLLNLYSTATWTGSIFESWDQRTPAEQTIVCDAINACGVAVVLWSGDDHQLGFDDGTNTDRSTNRNTKFPQINSSGMSQWGWRDLAGPYEWNGTEAEVEGNAMVFVEMEVTDNGGDDFSWVVRGFGAPYDSETNAPTLLTCGEGQTAEFASDDVALTVGVQGGISEQYVTDGGSVRLVKNWFGGNCSVDYDIDGGAITGTATFLPNQNTYDIEITGVTVPDDVTVLLSNPQGCTIDGATSITLKVREMADETATLINAMTTKPDDTRLGHIDTFVQALIDGGVWAKLDTLHVFAAHAEDAAKINWKNPGQFDCVEVGTVTFTTDQGVTFGGSASSIYTTDYSVGVSGQGTLETHAWGFWQRDAQNPSTYSPIRGSKFASGQARRSGNVYIRDFGASSRSVGAVSSSVGFTIVNRPDESTFAVYKGDSSTAMTLVASVDEGLATSYNDYSPIYYGGVNTAPDVYGTGTLLLGFDGLNLTSLQRTAFRNAAKTLLDALGSHA